MVSQNKTNGGEIPPYFQTIKIIIMKIYYNEYNSLDKLSIETRLVLMPKPYKGLSIGKQQELAKDILTFIDKSTKINLDYKKINAVYKSGDRVYIELFPKTNSDVKIIHKFLDKMYPQQWWCNSPIFSNNMKTKHYEDILL